jgi:hypothetical protein
MHAKGALLYRGLKISAAEVTGELEDLPVAGRP